MNKIDKVRLALIGAGAISAAYSQAIQRLDQTELVGVVDIDARAAATLAGSHECSAFESIASLCDKAKPEAAIVCTPPAIHAEHAIALMQQGVHVLCEKPLSVDNESAWEMVRTARQCEVVFTMASKFRFVEDVTKAKEIIADGVLGEIVLFENSFTGTVDMSQRWNSDPELSGGGVLIDNGTHSVDIMRYLLGPLAELRVVEGNRIQSLSVEDTVHIFVRSKAGVIGSIDLSWSIGKELPWFISLFGSNGTLHVGWKESKYRLKNETDWTVFGSGYDKLAAFENQLKNFTGAIRANEPLVIGPDDALASVYTIEAAYRAMQEPSWMPVKFSDEAYFNAIA